MSVAAVVLRKQRKHHNSRLLRSRVNQLNHNVTMRVRNENNDASSSNNDASRTISVEPNAPRVHHKLSVRRDLCDNNNSRVANASQHQRDRNRSRNNSDV